MRLTNWFLVIAVVGVAAPVQGTDPISGELIEALVVDVPRGDTLVVRVDGQDHTLRLYGIECPDPGEPAGEQAGWFTARLVAGGTVNIQVVRWEEEFIIGDVVRTTGNTLSGLLLDAGRARCNPAGKEEEHLVRLEKRAMAAGKGIWFDVAPGPDARDGLPVLQQGLGYILAPSDGFYAELHSATGTLKVESKTNHAVVPVGEYHLWLCVLRTKDQDGVLWETVCTHAPGRNRFSVRENETAELPVGAPFSARVAVDREGDLCRFSLGVTGKCGERYMQLRRGGRLASVPRFEILDERGAVIARGAFKYG